MSPEQVHARCAPGKGESIVTDEGALIRGGVDPVRVLGCAFPESRLIIVPYANETIGHEVSHILDAHCGY